MGCSGFAPPRLCFCLCRRSRAGSRGGGGMERELARSKARLPSLLLALLGLGPGIMAEARVNMDNAGLLPGNSSQTLLERCSELLFGQARTQPHQVNGVLGGAVLLSPALPPNRTVKEIEWSFSAGTGATIQVAELGPGGFERPDPKDRFKDRLEMFNQTGLRILALQRGDSGVYGARIKLHPAMVEDQFFNLSIYESVPSPRTRSQLLASTLEWCNVTLQCQGSGKGAVNVTWKQDNIEWERSSERHQLSPDGTTLRLWLPPAATNGTLACTVSNPADRRVVLFDLGAICQAGGGQSGFSKSGYIVLTLILLALSMGGAFWCWRVNSDKAAEPAASHTAPAEEPPPEAPCTGTERRSPPEGNDQGPSPAGNDEEPSVEQKAPVTTEHEQLHQAPGNTGEEVT